MTLTRNYPRLRVPAVTLIQQDDGAYDLHKEK